MKIRFDCQCTAVIVLYVISPSYEHLYGKNIEINSSIHCPLLASELIDE